MQLITLVAGTFALLAAAEPTTTSIAPHAVVSDVAPPSKPPAGCYEDYDGTFNIGPVNISSSSKRDLHSRNTNLGITLKGGVLTDPLGRTGYIASNQQFQFDGPPQAGAIWTGGFSVCQNNSLALGNDVFWWRCLSGNFYNLYFESIGGQCIQSYIQAYAVDGGHPVASGAVPSSAAASSTSSITSSAAFSTSSAVVAGGNSTSAASGLASSASSGNATAPLHHHTSTKTMHRSTTTGGSGSGSSGSASNSANGPATATSPSAGFAPSTGVDGAVLGLAGLFALAMI